MSIVYICIHVFLVIPTILKSATAFRPSLAELWLWFFVRILISRPSKKWLHVRTLEEPKMFLLHTSKKSKTGTNPSCGFRFVLLPVPVVRPRRRQNGKLHPSSVIPSTYLSSPWDPLPLSNARRHQIPPIPFAWLREPQRRRLACRREPHRRPHRHRLAWLREPQRRRLACRREPHRRPHRHPHRGACLRDPHRHCLARHRCLRDPLPHRFACRRDAHRIAWPVASVARRRWSRGRSVSHLHFTNLPPAPIRLF